MTKRNVITLIFVAAIVGGLTLFNTYQDPAKNWREQVERAKAEQGEPEKPMSAMEKNLNEMSASMLELQEAAEEIILPVSQKEGMITRDSGLVYRVMQEGSGLKPSRFSTVRVLYEGRFADGEVFDSALENPATFNLEYVIDGWKEALQLMREGGKLELVIPPVLGYGFFDASKVPAGSVLFFTVELVEVVDLPAIEP